MKVEYTAAKMRLLKPIRIDKATEIAQRTRPWLAWNLTNFDFLAPKMDANTRMPRYDSNARVFSIELGCVPSSVSCSVRG